MNKHLQISIMDLVFLLLIREENFQRNQLSENVQNLFTIIDVINLFNDRTKQKIIPERFLIQLENTLQDGIKLTRNDFEKYNNYFDNIADQELIHFINTYLSIGNSFKNFIENLENEFIEESNYIL